MSSWLSEEDEWVWVLGKDAASLVLMDPLQFQFTTADDLKDFKFKGGDSERWATMFCVLGLGGAFRYIIYNLLGKKYRGWQCPGQSADILYRDHQLTTPIYAPGTPIYLQVPSQDAQARLWRVLHSIG